MNHLRPLEKIQLSSSMIVFMLRSVERVMEQLERSGDEFAGSIADGHDLFLKRNESKFVEILNEVGDYLNAHDMVTDTDMRITHEIFKEVNKSIID